MSHYNWKYNLYRKLEQTCSLCMDVPVVLYRSCEFVKPQGCLFFNRNQGEPQVEEVREARSLFTILLRHSLPTIHTPLRTWSLSPATRDLVPVPVDILFVKAPLPYVLSWDRVGRRPHRLLTLCTRYRSLLRVLRTSRHCYRRKETVYMRVGPNDGPILLTSTQLTLNCSLPSGEICHKLACFENLIVRTRNRNFYLRKILMLYI